ncbi:16S rRNA (cytosine(967)-C(5))-methyltransferase RsmB [Suttonella sp. R2A3]|uniref:16S rRNA (cytosine(967)-C(5))-methyltransferase RsmB n=1 Tax=Suttonella sp. R2A3 TaxID=2908648 RepID=UPI001F322B4F|nr:16S rRNA (cytosine(967)-C(5))-methyltransferase RsmB [Suttonella sp. R2A3]UJF24173.1 16S rRNA (cytosine(967)-C(5))-methyltransferase RsmB [Suttonella sp. R2A3]
MRLENPRQAALNTILGVTSKQQSLTTLIPRDKADLKPKDQPLYQAMVYGCLREYQSLSSLRDELLHQPLQKNATTLAALINFGLYQLLRMQLGDHAVIHETVALAEHNNQARAKGLLNAVLRSAQRQQQKLITQLDERRYFNLPAWLKTHYQPEKDALAAAYTTQAPFTLRLRPSLDRELWLNEHSGARANTLSPQAVTIASGSDILADPAFQQGLISVQDAAAQLATELLAPQDGEHILDACAAPGGKTGHILEYANNLTLTALDHDQARLEQVADNLARLKQTATLIATDAAALEDWWSGKPFDAILLDAPCSGSGVIRRHPDIAWLRQAKDLARFPETQKQLLNQLWQTLKPGGRLLYTTCSILPAENQQVIEAFLSAQPQAKLKTISHPALRDTGYGMLHLPDRDGDGFFYALLEKSR